MKIVGLQELCGMPKGTIYTQVRDGHGTVDGVFYFAGASDYMRNEEGKYLDFYERNLLLLVDGEDFQAPEEDDISRWAEYDLEAKFIVYEEKDIRQLVKALTEGYE